MIAFSGKRKHGIRPGFQFILYRSSEMHPQKWEIRRRNGIEQVSDKVTLVLTNHIILSPEWDNTNLRLYSHHASYRISVEPSAVNNEPGKERISSGPHAKTRICSYNTYDLRIYKDFNPIGNGVLRHCLCYCLIVNDTCLRRVDSLEATGMRF